MRREHSSDSPISVRPVEWEVGGFEDEEDFEQIRCEEDSTSEEAKQPEVLRDPGAPTPRRWKNTTLPISRSEAGALIA